MNSRSFLLADDDRDDREMFCEALAVISNTINCLCSENGREALNTLTQLDEKPQVIFLDVNMPVMDGWQCLKQLKKDKKFNEIPVIMISTSSHQREIKMATDLGALCYFTKPNEFDELANVLKVIIANLGTGLPKALQHLQEAGSPFIYTWKE